MYILTGGAGFIGSAFLGRLNQEGIDDILVVDNLSKAEKWQNLVGKRFDDYLHKDSFLERVIEDRLGHAVKAVIHMGACSSTTETNADYMLRNNYYYSRSLAEWALKRGVRFIYASSAATYGDGALGFSDEDSQTPGLRPLNIYGYSKQLFDLWALKSGNSKKMAGIKFFNVYGPNEYHKGEMSSVVLKAFRQIRQTGKVKLFKSYRDDYRDGEQKRDFVYVKDCCDIMWQLLNDKTSGIYNLGTGKSRTWLDLANSVFAALGIKPNIEFIDMPLEIRDRYQYFTEARMDKLARSNLKLRFTPLEEGVRDYVQSYLATDCIYY